MIIIMNKFVLEGKYQSQDFGEGHFGGLLIRDGGLITAQCMIMKKLLIDMD